jgi:VanZ family protein
LINGLGNIVAFFPLGAVLYAALVADRLLRTRSIVLATLIGLIVSTTFEIIQIWIPGRVVALDDIILNTGGAIAGAWIAYLMHGHIQVKPRESALLQ